MISLVAKKYTWGKKNKTEFGDIRRREVSF
jgi:hypothetical protein